MEWLIGALPGALLLIGVAWAWRQAADARGRYLAALCCGGLIGIAATALFAFPAILRGNAARLLLSASPIARRALAAIPLGALISLGVTLISEGEKSGQDALR